jgi:thiamine kinase-like enzyme
MTDPLEVGSRFMIPGELQGCDPYGEGHIHRTYLLVSTDGSRTRRYILQRMNTRVFKKPESVQDNIHRILTFLKDNPANGHDFRDLEIIESLNGRLLHHEKSEGYWRCFRYIEESITLQKVENRDQAFEGGRGFGLFAARLIQYNPRRLHVTIPHFMDMESRNQQLVYAELTNPGERLNTAQPELRRVSALSQIPERFIRIRSALPDRVTHNDTKINNVLFDPDNYRAIGIIDLDTVMTGTLLTDFGDMVRSFTASGREDEVSPEAYQCREDVFEGLTAGYAGAVKGFISDVERSNLLLGAKAVIYMQAVRFLTDYLNGDTYYRTSYPEQNLHRTRNQLGLLDSLLSKEKLLEGILRRHF